MLLNTSYKSYPIILEGRLPRLKKSAKKLDETDKYFGYQNRSQHWPQQSVRIVAVDASTSSSPPVQNW
jgi:hypothetical protein